MYKKRLNKFISLLLLFLIIFNLSSTILSPSRIEAKENQLEYRFVSNRNGANVRLGKGVNYPIYSFALNNVTLEGVREGAWFKIDDGDKFVYIAYNLTLPFERNMEIRYVKADRANIRSNKTTSSKIVEKTYRNDAYIGSREGAWFKTYIDKKPVYLAYNLTSGNEQAGEYRYVNGNGINIRSKPSANSQIIGRAYLNEELEGIRIGSWFKLEKNGQTGFISYAWTSEDMTRPRFAKVGGANIRSGPGTGYRSLGRTREGQKFMGVRQGAWFKTSYQGKTAYIAYNLSLSSPKIQVKFKPNRVNYINFNRGQAYGRFNGYHILEGLGPNQTSLTTFEGDLLKIDSINKPRPGFSVVDYMGDKYYAANNAYSLVKMDYKSSYLDSIPFKYRRYVSGLMVVDDLGEDIAGMYNNYSKHIDILEEYRYDEEIIYHEIGHAVSFNADRNGGFLHDSKQWINIWKEEWQGRSGYGSKDEAEGFAEAFTAYICGQAAHYKGNLAMEKPLSYHYMNNLISKLPTD